MEHGSIPPRRDIAERLAAVLELDREPLLMWADTRMTPRGSDDVLREREQVETLFAKRRCSAVATRSPRPPACGLVARTSRATSGRSDRRRRGTLRQTRPRATLDEPPNQIPILPPEPTRPVSRPPLAISIAWPSSG
jgi:hypothetical protein